MTLLSCFGAHTARAQNASGPDERPDGTSLVCADDADFVPEPPVVDLSTLTDIGVLELARGVVSRNPSQAAEAFGVLATRLPSLDDRFALEEGYAWQAAGQFEKAALAFTRAMRSIDRRVQVLSEVASLECALHQSGASVSVADVDRLYAAYPKLGGRDRFDVLLALSLAEHGDLAAAELLSRRVLASAESGRSMRVAEGLLTEIYAMRGETWSLSVDEELARARRLAEVGDRSDADAALQELITRDSVPVKTRAVAIGIMAEVAKRYGSYVDASALGQRTKLAKDADTDLAAHARDTTSAMRDIGALLRGREVSALTSGELVRLAVIAARAGIRTVTAEALQSLSGRDLLDSERFDVAIECLGVADQQAVVLLAQVASSPTAPADLSTAAHFHRGDALLRLRQRAEGSAALRGVSARDSKWPRWYRHLAELSLAYSPGTTSETESDTETSRQASRCESCEQAHRERVSKAHDELVELEETYGRALPWIARARVLLELEDEDAARDELYEAVVAVRATESGGGRARGLDAVLGGEPESWIGRPTLPTNKRLRAMSKAGRAALANVLTLLDEIGPARALGFDPEPAWIPYEAEISAAAEAHDVDPYLLRAVMRIESVQDRTILSPVGAIGLMQIMPRTGLRIAAARELPRFTVLDLLRPSTNIDFAAWYLRSLLTRFDGRIPLAVAAYNGGPHNVRRWMATHSSATPLAAFLETIPFEETRRYVRRVMGAYASYRADAHEPPLRLDPTLPPVREDSVGF